MPESETGMYPIGVVSEITGVNTVTLRAWERRYALLVPERTAGGRRLYSQADIERIKKVQLLMQKGISIGQMRTALARQERIIYPSEPPKPDPEKVWNTSIANMLEAIGHFDEVALENTYNNLLSLYPLDLVIQYLLIPLMGKLGERWEARQRDTAVAEEHFFSVYMRNKLGARFHHHQTNPKGVTLLLACLPDENHEIGLLLFALAASGKSYRVIVLGANMPLEELAGASQRCQTDAIVLSTSMTPAAELIENRLSKLCRTVDIPVFIGGHAVHQHQNALAAAGTIPLPCDIYTGLAKIENHLSED